MKSKKIVSLVIVSAMMVSVALPGISAFAAQRNTIIIGSNVDKNSKEQVMDYLNMKPTLNNVVENKETKSEALVESGDQSSICTYAQMNSLNEVTIRTTNLTYVTANMIASSLVAAGIFDVNEIVVSPISVTGEDSLNNAILAYEKVSGETVAKSRKDIANKELSLLISISKNPNSNQDKATALLSDIQNTIFKYGEFNSVEVTNLVDCITRTSHTKVTDSQKNEIISLMNSIIKENYNTTDMKTAISYVNFNANKALQKEGELKSITEGIKLHIESVIKQVKAKLKRSKSVGIINSINLDSNLYKYSAVTGSSYNVKDAMIPTKDLKETVIEKEKSLEVYEKTLKNKNTESPLMQSVKSQKSIGDLQNTLDGYVSWSVTQDENLPEILRTTPLVEANVNQMVSKYVTQEATEKLISTKDYSKIFPEVKITDKENPKSINIPIYELVGNVGPKDYVNISFTLLKEDVKKEAPKKVDTKKVDSKKVDTKKANK